MHDRSTPVLTAIEVTKTFAGGGCDVPVLNGISFDVHPGEFLTVMGPSGCGKSTLLHLLSGLDRPTSGDIRIEGRSIVALPRRQMSLLRREKIGFIFQFFNLLPHLTVRENILMPLLIGNTRPDGVQDRLDALVRWIGIGSRMDHFPGQLSGGEMQRVSIARALIHAPAIVLADEPTGNVSTSVGEDIMRRLRECADARGQTILLVTHNPKDAAAGDRVLFLKDGIIAHRHTLTGPDVHERNIFTCLQELGI
jgi:putative ABC transport system ATP-binding protein